MINLPQYARDCRRLARRLNDLAGAIETKIEFYLEDLAGNIVLPEKLHLRHFTLDDNWEVKKLSEFWVVLDAKDIPYKVFPRGQWCEAYNFTNGKPIGWKILKVVEKFEDDSNKSGETNPSTNQ